jgi:hypothetical protein
MNYIERTTKIETAARMGGTVVDHVRSLTIHSKRSTGKIATI